MPRRSSSSNADGSPVTRRVSARIAGAQVASPAKSTKSPRRKRQSTENAKVISDDTESQQSQVKSETSVEELNGVVMDTLKDSNTDSAEIPHKKAKIDIGEENDEGNDTSEVISKNNEKIISDDNKNADVVDFEVIEHDTVPLPDSDEVKSVISVQGEDGHLLVGFVQVDKSELPEANSAENKHISSALINKHTFNCESEIAVNNVNSNGISDEDIGKTNGNVEEIQQKIPISPDALVQSSITSATGDIVPEMVVKH